jgi:hypothetical protein
MIDKFVEIERHEEVQNAPVLKFPVDREATDDEISRPSRTMFRGTLEIVF